MAHDPYASLRFPEYRAFLAGMGTVFAATQIQSAALGWQVYLLTGDPLSLGLIGLAEAIPFLSLTLVGGWVADRVDRRHLSMLGLGAIGASAAWLLTATLAGPRSALPLYLAQALAGLGRAFFRPATGALGAEIVRREHYHNAASWRSSIAHAAMVVGPATGGALIALGGPRLAYAAVVLLLLAGLVAFTRVGRRPIAATEGDGLLAGLQDGVGFVFAHPLLLAALSLDLFAVLFGGATALLPIFARDLLRVGEVGFGFMRAAPAIGSVAMSLALVRFGHFRRAGRVLLWCVAAFGLTWIAFALSRWWLLSIALLAIGGAFDNVSVVLRNVLVQTFTPREKMGRVSAVSGFFIGSSNELGAFESGVAARLLGVVPSVLFGGAMTLVTVATVAWRAPALRKLERIGGEDQGAGARSSP